MDSQQPSYWNQLKTGVGNGLWNNTIGVAEYLYRPKKILETAEGLYSIAKDPVPFVYAFGNAIYQQPVKEISEIATGILVGRIIGKFVSYATKSETIKHITTVTQERVSTVVQKLVQTPESIAKLAKLKGIINDFKAWAKNPSLYNPQDAAIKYMEFRKIATSVFGSGVEKQLEKFASFFSFNEGPFIPSAKTLEKIAVQAEQLGEKCFAPILEAGQVLVDEVIYNTVEIVTTSAVPTEVVRVSSTVAGNVANGVLLTENLGQKAFHQHLEQQPIMQYLETPKSVEPLPSPIKQAHSASPPPSMPLVQATIHPAPIPLTAQQEKINKGLAHIVRLKNQHRTAKGARRYNLGELIRAQEERVRLLQTQPSL